MSEIIDKPTDKQQKKSLSQTRDKSLESLNNDLAKTMTTHDLIPEVSDEEYETELEEIYIAYTNQYIRDETGKYINN